MRLPHPLKGLLSKGDRSLDHLSGSNQIATLFLCSSRQAQGRTYLKDPAPISTIGVLNAAARIILQIDVPKQDRHQGKVFTVTPPTRARSRQCRFGKGVLISPTWLNYLTALQSCLVSFLSTITPQLFYLFQVHLIALLMPNLELKLG